MYPVLFPKSDEYKYDFELAMPKCDIDGIEEVEIAVKHNDNIKTDTILTYFVWAKLSKNLPDERHGIKKGFVHYDENPYRYSDDENYIANWMEVMYRSDIFTNALKQFVTFHKVSGKYRNYKKKLRHTQNFLQHFENKIAPDEKPSQD